jgi:hypothetical protein
MIRCLELANRIANNGADRRKWLMKNSGEEIDQHRGSMID